MKKAFPILVIILLSATYSDGCLFAQMVQYGIVTENNLHGKTLNGVSVTVPSAHDCQPTASNNHGEFRLSFGEHHDGDVIHGLRVRKNGYEVVNIHVTRDGWTLTSNDTLRIVMAPVGKLHEARMKYYDLLETACVAQYNNTMDFLNGQLASQTISEVEYQYWKVQAENELQQAYASIDVHADWLARFGLVNDTEASLALVEDPKQETVLQAYNNFSLAFPMENEENVVASSDTIPTPVVEVEKVPDSIQNNILILQTYTKLFENDMEQSSLKYAKSCLYLGTIYKDLGWNEAAQKYMLKALRMFELLSATESKSYTTEISHINKVLSSLTP